jgi:isopenicillin N synthase-like dioxygenase
VWLPESTLPGFRAFTTNFYWECWTVAQQILRALALGLNLPDEDYLLRFHSGHNNQLRLLHYPPVPESVLKAQSATRMPAHTDWGSITMLFQDDCGGLEVETRGKGQYVSATPVKNAIVMNVGDILMRWSNGPFSVLFQVKDACLLTAC